MAQAAGKPPVFFTQARRIILDNLTPDTTYTVQARAIGGSTGSSDWNDPISHMSWEMAEVFATRCISASNSRIQSSRSSARFR
jgi:hypothetical protein